MEYISNILKALSDPIRLRIISLLRHGELCVCDVTESLQLPQSTVSRHLGTLRRTGWVKAHRRGKWMHYMLDASSSTQVRIADILTGELPMMEICQEDDKRYFAYLAVESPHACDPITVTTERDL